MAIFLIFACAIVILIFILPYWLIPANPFSEPSGKWQVGTTDLIWDKPDLSGIIAKAWYPTDVKNNTSAPYIDNIDLTLSALTAGMNPLFKLIFNKRYLNRIRTPVSIDAIPANSPNGFPVILFSPGLAAINFLNTFYALEFASHGFIVIGINHPGSNISTILTNGSHVGMIQILNLIDLVGESLNSKQFISR
jgi:Platelet-activating factor acetylhydrolase, isoform II